MVLNIIYMIYMVDMSENLSEIILNRKTNIKRL